MNKDRPRATLRCPQCGFKVPLGDRQYVELQRRLRVIAVCPRCRLTFPYSAVGERVVGPAAASTAEQPSARAGADSAPDLQLASDGPAVPRLFAPTAEGPLRVPALETDVVEEQPCLTIAESGSGEQPAPRRSLLTVWRGFSAPGRWVIITSLILSLGLVIAATVYRVVVAAR
jgi:hypothetical protein